jgi:hypothetical protein
MMMRCQASWKRHQSARSSYAWQLYLRCLHVRLYMCYGMCINMVQNQARITTLYNVPTAVLPWLPTAVIHGLAAALHTAEPSSHVSTSHPVNLSAYPCIALQGSMGARQAQLPEQWEPLLGQVQVSHPAGLCSSCSLVFQSIVNVHVADCQVVLMHKL